MSVGLLPSFAASVPLEFALNGIEEVHLRLLLAMSRVGIISDDDLESLSGANLSADDVRRLISEGWTRWLDQEFNFKVLGITMDFIIPSENRSKTMDFDADEEIGVILGGAPDSCVMIGPAFAAIDALCPGAGQAGIHLVEEPLFRFGIPHTPAGCLELCREAFWYGDDDECLALTELGEDASAFYIPRRADLFDGIPGWALNECKVPTCERFELLARKYEHHPVGNVLKSLAALEAMRDDDLFMQSFCDVYGEEYPLNEPPVLLRWADEDFAEIYDEHHNNYMQGECAAWVGRETFPASEEGISEVMPRILHTARKLRALDAVLNEIEDFNRAQK